MHEFATEVFYEDTDMGGIVYHANYLKFCERGRSAFVKSLGCDQLALRDSEGLVFVIREVNAKFLKPARFEDRLTVTTAVTQCSGARLVLDQCVIRDGETLFRAQVELAMMTLAGRPARMPADLRARLLGD